MAVSITVMISDVSTCIISKGYLLFVPLLEHHEKIDIWYKKCKDLNKCKQKNYAYDYKFFIFKFKMNWRTQRRKKDFLLGSAEQYWKF